MVRKILIAFLVLTAPVFAARRTITSLPYTFTPSMMTGGGEVDTLELASDLSSATSGITITSTTSTRVENVFLDGGGHTITFGTGGTGNIIGLSISGTAALKPRNIHVRDLNIVHSENGASVDTVYGVLMSCIQSSLRNVRATVRGENQSSNGAIHGLYASGQNIWGNVIDSCVFRNLCRYYHRRDHYLATAIKINDMRGLYSGHILGYDGDPEDFYHFEVNACSLFAHHAPLIGYGRSDSPAPLRLKITNNFIQPDAANDKYSYPSGSIFWGASNAYSIGLTFPTGGTIITGNTCIAGTSNEGGRGIYVAATRFDDSAYSEAPIDISGNYIDVHNGPDDNYRPNDCHGIRVRAGSPTNVIRWVQLKNNTIIVRADADEETIHTDLTAFGIRWSTEGSAGEHCVIENNRIFTYTTASGGTGQETYGLCFDAFTVGGENIVIRNNYIASQNYPLAFGEYNDGAHDITVGPGDTIAFIDPLVNARTIKLGHLANSWDCSNNELLDPVFLNGTSPDDIAVAGGGTLELTVRRNITIRALGAVNALPRSGATITVINDYEDTVLTGTTTSAGLVTGAVTMLYETRVGTDSALDQFGPFRAYAEYGDSVAANINWVVGFNTAESALVTLSIPGVSGDGSYANQSPQITSVYPSGVTFNFGDTIEPRFSVTDDNGIQYAFLWLRRAGGELIPGTSSDSFLVAGQYFSSGFPTAYSDTGSYVLNFSGNFTIRAIVVDTAGARVVQTSATNYSTPGTVNTPPSFTSITPSNTVLRVGQATAYSYTMTDDQGLDSAIGWVLRPGGTILDTLFRQSISGGTVTINGSYTPGSTDTGFVWFVGRVRDDSTVSVTDSCALINYVEKEYPTVMRARDGVTFRGAVRIRSGGIMTEVPPYVEED